VVTFLLEEMKDMGGTEGFHLVINRALEFAQYSKHEVAKLLLEAGADHTVLGNPWVVESPLDWMFRSSRAADKDEAKERQEAAWKAHLQVCGCVLLSAVHRNEGDTEGRIVIESPSAMNCDTEGRTVINLHLI
jgi:hypothetical protein